MSAFASTFMAFLISQHVVWRGPASVTSCNPTCNGPRVRKIASPSRLLMTTDGGLSYTSSGVDIDLESASVRSLIRGLKSFPKCRQPGELGAVIDHAGGFSGLIEFGENLLAICTDGVGSKLMLAADLEYYETVGFDCVAMNVNDLLCIGAEPLAFVDYIAAERPSPVIWEALGRSLSRACTEAQVSLCGGETASLKGMVSGIDMSGTALGWLPRGTQIDGRSVAVGDAIIGLASSGIHSNGFSLVRKVIEKAGISLHDAVPFHSGHDRLWRHTDESLPVTFGEVLLNPTTIYVNPVIDLLKSCRSAQVPCEYKHIHGLAHITGGGLSNLLRLKAGMGYLIEEPLPVLPEFEWMQKVGDISSFEMYRTFNMGMGMVIIVQSKVADQVVEWICERFKGVGIVGVVNGSGVVTHSPTGVRYNRY